VTPLDCAALRDAIEPLAAGTPPTAQQRAHLDGCASCQAQLALAVRLERVLAEWPAPAPAAAFAQRVIEATRRQAWRREVVVDWGFNLAIASGLAAVVVGLASLVWLLGSAAGPAASSQLVTDATTALLDRVRSQAAVMATASLLLTTTLGAWWWAEGRGRW
jgi:hypothetical protein